MLSQHLYIHIGAGGGVNYNLVLKNIWECSASPPLYFIQYYIILSLWGPLLYAAIKYLVHKDIMLKYKLTLGILLFVLIWIIGYFSIGRMDIFGRSYFFVYALGLLMGQIEIHKVKYIYFIPAFMILLIGLVSMKRFYWARLAGVYDYSGGINFLAPNLQMNPPNISIILYSLGVIAVAYLCFEICNSSERNLLRMVGGFFSILGKYSMDIFLWHLYIQDCLNIYFVSLEKNMIKWLIYYGAMFAVPIAARFLYNKTKMKMYSILKL